MINCGEMGEMGERMTVGTRKRKVGKGGCRGWEENGEGGRLDKE